MGSVFKQMVTRPIPAGATVTRQPNGRTVARWRGRGTKWKTAEVITTDDGRQVIRQESGTFYAKYRAHDGTVVVVSTGCRDESTARQCLADLELQQDRVRAGVVTSQELAVADQMSDPIDR